MAFIAPNSDFEFMQNVPLDNTYEHTLYFPSITAQNTYFASKVKTAETYSIPVVRVAGETPIETVSVQYSLTKQSYQRSGDNTIRVEIPTDCLYDCNYCRYRNSAFNRKWFYAFITNVKYINTHVSEVTLEIDEMQTWFWHCTLMDSFIERQHSITDNIGDNIIPENIDIGDEYILHNKSVFDMNDMCICILVNRKVVGENTNPPTSTMVNGVYTPVRIYTYPLTGTGAVTPADIDDFIDQFQEDEIITVYQYPKFMGVYDATTPTIPIANFPSLSLPQDPWGFTVKNNKLYTHPFIMLQVLNNCGGVGDYRFEDSTEQGIWTGSKVIKFLIQGAFATTPCVIAAPINYRGFSVQTVTNDNVVTITDYNADYASGLTYANFPQCAWSGDAFKAWWAQNRSGIIAGAVSTGIGTVSSLVGIGSTINNKKKTPSVGGALSPVGYAIDLVGQVKNMEHVPNQTFGQVLTDSLNIAVGRQRFDFNIMKIKPEFAKIVDDFFTKYGYAIKEIKRPNIHARTNWTFIKTVNAVVDGYNTNDAYLINNTSINVPANSVNKICQILDNGITFWNSSVTVGDYSITNPIYTPPPQNGNNS